MEPQTAAEELLRRRRARTLHTEYLEYLRPTQLPDFHHTPADHHILFADALDQLQASLTQRSEEGDRVAISVPPGAAKSFYGSITYPTKLLASDPRMKIICVSAGELLAEDFARRRRAIMSTPEWQRLAGASLAQDSKALHFMGTTKGGGIYAVGAGTTIQGLRADALIADDLVAGFEMAASVTQLDKLWNWYLSEARSRLRPGGIELMIATRWAMLDPIGRVLRLTKLGHEAWRYLRLPMEADSDDDPLGRPLGARLWPEYFTARMVTDAKRNALVWNTLYQQNPRVSEHAWAPLDKIHYAERATFPQRLRIYIGCDIALHVGVGDHTVLAVIGIDDEKRFYILDLWRKQCDTNESCRAFLALCQQYQPSMAWVDNDNTSIVWGRQVEMEARRQGMHSPLTVSKMMGRDKEVRAANLRSLFLQDRVVIAKADWNAALLRELAEFPDSDINDIVDAIAVVAKELHKLSGPARLEEVSAPPPIEGALQMIEGKIMTRSTVDELFAPTLSVGRLRRL